MTAARMKRQWKRVCCLLTLVVTSTGALVSVNRPSRVASTLPAKESNQSLRDEESSPIRTFFSSSDTPEAEEANDNSGWAFGFFRRNRKGDARPETRPKGKRPLDRKKEDKKKLKEIKAQLKKNNQDPKEKKKQIKKQKEKIPEKSTRQGRSFVSGLFASTENDDKKETKPSKKKEDKTESSSPQSRNFVSGLFSGNENDKETKPSNRNKEETSEGSLPQARNFLSGLFASNEKEDTDKKKNEEPDKNISSVFSSVQRFFGGTFTSNNQEQWVPVFPKTRLSPGEIVPATIGGIDLLVIASKDGRKLYCIANSCSHLGTPLETGKIVRLPVEGSEGTEDTSRQPFTETEVSAILQQDGLEDCIVCPLHRTAFALKSGEVRGEWCPYPPVVGKLVGTVKQPTGVATFDIRTKGKQIEVRINSLLDERDDAVVDEFK